MTVHTPSVIDRTTARILRQRLDSRDRAILNLGLRLDGLILAAQAIRTEHAPLAVCRQLDALTADMALARLELNGEGPDAW